MKVFKKHKTKNVYWSFDLKEYVTQNMIPIGSLVIDHNGKDISKSLKATGMSREESELNTEIYKLLSKIGGAE